MTHALHYAPHIALCATIATLAALCHQCGRAGAADGRTGRQRRRTEMTDDTAYRNLVEQRSIALDYLEDPAADIPDGTRRYLLALLDDGRLHGPHCGKTTATSGTEHPPCARPAGHPEAYCRAADRQAYFIATEEPTR